MNTPYIKLTDLWSDGEYTKVGRILEEESWSPSQMAEFCAYFVKYCGISQLEVLYKFI